jgi:hypothetical protein
MTNHYLVKTVAGDEGKPEVIVLGRFAKVTDALDFIAAHPFGAKALWIGTEAGTDDAAIIKQLGL